MANALAFLAAGRRGAPAPHLRASFSGAGAGRLFGDSPFGGALHPDRHVQHALAPLRERARELERNDSNIDGFLRTAAINVIGPRGFDLQAQVRDGSGDLAEKTNREIERAWKDFGKKGKCTPCGKFSLTQFCHLLYTMRKRDGEAFVRIIEGPEWPHGMVLQPIPADMLDESYDGPPDEDGVETRQGITVDRYGRPLFYNFSKRHPGDRWGNARADRIPVPAADVIHLHRVRSAGQSRGYSELASMLFDVLMFRGAVEAELVAWRQSACKAGVLVSKDPAAIEAYLRAMPRETDGSVELPDSFELAPGMNEYVAPGWEYQNIDPTHPNTNLEGAAKVFYRRMARGGHISYGSFTGDISDANYSSMRAGLLPERDEFSTEHQDFISDFLDPVFERWMGAGLLSGSVRLDSRLAAQYQEHEFRPRGWESVDPLKDRQADLLAVLCGIDTRTRQAAKHGRDFEEVIDQLAHEMAYANRRGVPIDGEPSLLSLEDEDDEPAGTGRPPMSPSRAALLAAIAAALPA